MRKITQTPRRRLDTDLIYDTDPEENPKVQKKYALKKTSQKCEWVGDPTAELYQIVAIRDFTISSQEVIKAGDCGGFVHGFQNLSHEGCCWIHHPAVVADVFLTTNNAQIRPSARCYWAGVAGDDCEISGIVRTASLYGKVKLARSSVIDGNSYLQGEIIIGDNVAISGESALYGKLFIAHSTQKEPYEKRAKGKPAEIKPLVIKDSHIRSENGRITGDKISLVSVFMEGDVDIHTATGGSVDIVGGRFYGTIGILRDYKATFTCRTTKAGFTDRYSGFLGFPIRVGVKSMRILEPNSIKQITAGIGYERVPELITFIRYVDSKKVPDIFACRGDSTANTKSTCPTYYNSCESIEAALIDLRFLDICQEDIPLISHLYYQLKDQWIPRTNKKNDEVLNAKNN
jgi:hypothetical protein